MDPQPDPGGEEAELVCPMQTAEDAAFQGEAGWACRSTTPWGRPLAAARIPDPSRDPGEGPTPPALGA
jgi:hypothetical protein